MVHPESLNDALKEALEDEYREGKEDSGEEDEEVKIDMENISDSLERIDDSKQEEEKRKMSVIQECVEEITHEDHVSDVVAEKVKENKLRYCQFEIYDEVNAVLEQQQ